MYECHQIYINADMSRDLYMKRRELDPIKKKLCEKQIMFSLVYLAQLRVKWKEREITLKISKIRYSIPG
jgi:hypothetical protein